MLTDLRFPAVEVNWLGDVIMPLGVLVISLLASVWIASASAAASRQTVIFQHDLEYAEEFLSVLEPDWGGQVFDASEQNSRSRWSAVNHARVRFTSRASGQADHALSGYLSYLEQIIWAAQRRFYDRVRELEATGLSSIVAYGKALDEQRARHPWPARDALENMVRTVRDWPFPEARPRILRDVAEQTIANWHVPPTDHELAVARLMLNLRPSRNVLMQRSRALVVWMWGWIDTFRFDGVTTRVSNWKRGREEGRPWRGFKRRERNAAYRARREAIALRRLQETAHRHYGATARVTPFQFVEVPPRLPRWRRRQR